MKSQRRYTRSFIDSNGDQWSRELDGQEAAVAAFFADLCKLQKKHRVSLQVRKIYINGQEPTL